MFRVIFAATIIVCSLFADYNNITLDGLLKKTALLNNINIVIPKDLNTSATYDITINSFIKAKDLLEVTKILLKRKGYTLNKLNKFYLITKIKDTRYKIIYKVKNANSNVILKRVKNIYPDNLEKLDNKFILIRTKTKQQAKSIIKTLSKVDYTSKTYFVYINIYETDTNVLNRVGINMNNLNVNKEAGTILFKRTITPDLLPSLITLLNDKQKTKLVSSPKLILTPDTNSTAYFSEGLTVPIKIKKSQIVPGTNPVVTDITDTIYKDIGLKLTLKYLSKTQDNKIKFYLDLEDTNLINYTDTGITTTNRQITTSLQVKLNKTVFIAGLGRETHKTRIVGVPVLKDIPILKYLFSRKETQKENRTLLITLQIKEI